MYFRYGPAETEYLKSRDARLGTVDTRYVIGKAVLLAFPGPDSVTEKRDFGRIGIIA